MILQLVFLSCLKIWTVAGKEINFDLEHKAYFTFWKRWITCTMSASVVLSVGWYLWLVHSIDLPIDYYSRLTLDQHLVDSGPSVYWLTCINQKLVDCRLRCWWSVNWGADGMLTKNSLKDSVQLSFNSIQTTWKGIKQVLTWPVL